MSAPDRLCSERMRAALGPVTIGREIVVLDKATSTNDAVAQMATANRAEGLVVFAEHQTSGRGQRGNRWESAAYKGLWFSVLLRPRIEVQDSPRLTSWAAQAVALTVENSCRLPATVKSPNDVYIIDRKVAGVLVEMRAQPAAPHLAIVGVGVNVNQAPADFPEELRDRATSLAIARGVEHDRNELAVALLRNLDRTYGGALIGADEQHF